MTNTRLLLQMLLEQGGTKATVAGNLNRELVRVIASRLTGLDTFLEDLSKWKKTWNEEDVHPLSILRHVAQFAGIISKTKTMFRVTKKGETLLAPDKAGALYALLFRTFFRKLNLATLDGVGECPGVQYAMAYSLLMLKRWARDWISIEDLTPKLFLPFVMAEIPVSLVSAVSRDSILAETRVIDPLIRFGLLESRSDESQRRIFRRPIAAVRKTPLFDKFLDFNLDAPWQGRCILN